MTNAQVEEDIVDVSVLNETQLDLVERDHPEARPWRREADLCLSTLAHLSAWNIDRVRVELGCNTHEPDVRSARMLRKCSEYLNFVCNRVARGASVIDRRSILTLITEVYEKSDRSFRALLGSLTELRNDHALSCDDYIAFGDPYTARRAMHGELGRHVHLEQVAIEGFVLRPTELQIQTYGSIADHVESCAGCRARVSQVELLRPLFGDHSASAARD